MIGAGAGALIAAGFGADPYSVLIDGVASTFGVLHVFAAAACGLTMIVLGRLLGGTPTVVTFVAPACASLALQAGVQAPAGWTTAVVAVLAYWCGLSLYLGAGLGAGAVEFCSATVAARHGHFDRWLNVSLVVYTVAGVALGGGFGFLTVVLALSSGQVADRGRRFVAARLHR